MHACFQPLPDFKTDDRTRCNNCRIKKKGCSFLGPSKPRKKAAPQPQEESSRAGGRQSARQVTAKRKDAPDTVSQSEERSTRAKGGLGEVYVSVKSRPVGGLATAGASSSSSFVPSSRVPSQASRAGSSTGSFALSETHAEVFSQFEKTIASINDVHDQAMDKATRALQEAMRAREEARRSHAKVTGAFMSMMRGIFDKKSTVAGSSAAGEQEDEDDYDNFEGIGSHGDGADAEGDDEVEGEEAED